ncbi:MAG: hypothetical protein K8T10_15830 [Candidatus Eremiobacteraeota bacterium]|nr:hypothetical protein [Candidatus Eremiobacteraeota bacterium]
MLESKGKYYQKDNGLENENQPRIERTDNERVNSEEIFEKIMKNARNDKLLPIANFEEALRVNINETVFFPEFSV